VKGWTDEKLYKEYGVTSEEQKFIESMIKPMEWERGSHLVQLHSVGCCHKRGSYITNPLKM